MLDGRVFDAKKAGESCPDDSTTSRSVSRTSGGQLNGTGLIVDDLGRVGETVGMPRTARGAPGGMVFGVLNLGVGGML